MVLALLFAASARAQDVQGTVFEVANAARTPAANAFVIVHWIGRRPGLGHYESVCIQAAIGRTDAQGRFAIAEPPPLRSTFLVFRDDPAVAVWKPGFDAQGKYPEWSLVRTRLNSEQRRGLVEILQDYGCRDDQGSLLPLTDPQGVLADFRRALAAELPAKKEGREVRILQRRGPAPASR